MSLEERMTIDERRKYLHKMRSRYGQAQGRKERSQLLDEMAAVTDLHRKSLLRLLHGELARKPRRTQRGKTYGPQVKAAAQVIAESLDYPCAERLQPNLVWMAKHLEQFGELTLSADLEQKLSQISVSSLRRLLGPVGQARNRIAYSKQPPGTPKRLLQAVPMRRIAWDERQPGHFEIDLVHHSGPSSEGQYAHTLQWLDVAIGWSECIPILGRSYRVMEDGFQGILQRLPYPVHELHPDNGSEFFNHFLLKYYAEQLPEADLSRSRPYQKNDNRFVEENNYSEIRAYVGYGRFDTVAHLRLLHQLYEQLWLYHNFFLPVMRLVEKTQTGPFRYKRVYDQARPPFDRLCATGVLDAATLSRLKALRADTNPRQVRHRIEQLTVQLYELPLAQEGLTEDVFQTLGLWKASHLFSAQTLLEGTG